jgi:hypothetical protein
VKRVKRAKLLIFKILFRGQVYDIMTIEGYSLRDEKPGDKELHYILSRTLARILPASGDVGIREKHFRDAPPGRLYFYRCD